MNHGTVGGYTNERCRCEECRGAHAAYVAAWRARVRNRAPVDAPPHGNYYRYSNYGCTCRACRDANAAYRRQLRENADV